MEYGPDSQRRDDVPRGQVKTFEWQSEYAARDTWRTCRVYVPAQYDPQTAIGLMVFQDGSHYADEDGPFRAPIVFDNLIHAGKMPPVIGLFVDPGHSDPQKPDNPFAAKYRSFEYDKLGDVYVSWLINNLIPEIARDYNLADDPKKRAICGISSGGICAFTAAWERPDYFHKVMSHVGSFTDINGGHIYPTLIRKSTPRDIRVYLHASTNDLNILAGNWWLANLQMESALAFREYDYRFESGESGHDAIVSGPVFPQALEWLWR